MNPENLLLEKVELDYMKELAALISRSPRAVKRFVNVYRLMRAAVLREDLEGFVGSESTPGTHRQVLWLLSLVIGTPAVFDHIQAQDENIPFQKFLQDLENAEAKVLPFTATSEWAKMKPFLTDLGNYYGHHLTFMEFRAWAAEVGRYSFRVGRIETEG